MASLSIRLPKELKAKVSRIAKRRNVSRAAVVRDAIGAYAGADGGVAAHLKGCFKGLPRDLLGCSTHVLLRLTQPWR